MKRSATVLAAPDRAFLDALLVRYGLPEALAERFQHILAALASQPDPHTTASAPAEALRVHLADSLEALRVPAVREARTLLDIGSGAGFPGLALALALPDCGVELVEAANRKCRVVEALIAAGGLANARVIRARAEDHAHGGGSSDVVTARAVGSLALVCEYAAPLLRTGGTLVAWKGSPPPDERAGGERAAAAVGLEPGPVLPSEPFEGAGMRTLYLYEKVRPTPDRFPRRAGAARKRPL